MKERCHVLLPRIDFQLQGEHDGCLNISGHLDEHINILPDSRIIFWESDNTCGCDPEDEYCECFVWNEVDISKMLQILQENYDNQTPDEIIEILKKHRALQ